MENKAITPNLILEHTESIFNEFDDAFPVSAFPEPIQEIIRATNHYLKFPNDFMGASMLFAASVAIGNTHRVNVLDNWSDNVTLYIGLVGRPGINKSHPLKTSLDPIFKKDISNHSKYKKDKADYDKAIKQGEEPPPIPLQKKTLWSDFTQEVIVKGHYFNRRGLGVYSDEINSWIKNLTRYASGGAIEFWLSNFSGVPIDNIRLNNFENPILIPTPSISVCGGIQPGILKELKKDNKAENGFIDRFLWAFPTSTKKEVWSTEKIPPVFIERWNKIVNNLLSLPLLTNDEGEIEPKVIDFNTFAEDELRKWQAKNTEEINNTINDSLRGVYGKFDYFVCRFSLILELLNIASENQNKPDYSTLNDTDKINFLYRKAVKLCHPDKNNFEGAEEIMKQLNSANKAGDLASVEKIYNSLNKPKIGLTSVLAAIKLVNYFKQTARRVNSILNNTPVEGLSERKKAFYQLLPQTFKTDEAVKIGDRVDYPERTLKDFLNDRDFFLKLDYAKYQKLF
jgi:hypothetical protein